MFIPWEWGVGGRPLSELLQVTAELTFWVLSECHEQTVHPLTSKSPLVLLVHLPVLSMPGILNLEHFLAYSFPGCGNLTPHPCLLTCNLFPPFPASPQHLGCPAGMSFSLPLEEVAFISAWMLLTNKTPDVQNTFLLFIAVSRKKTRI